MYMVRKAYKVHVEELWLTRLPEQQQGPPPCLNSLVFGGGKLKPQPMFSVVVMRSKCKMGCMVSSVVVDEQDCMTK